MDATGYQSWMLENASGAFGDTGRAICTPLSVSGMPRPEKHLPPKGRVRSNGC